MKKIWIFIGLLVILALILSSKNSTSANQVLLLEKDRSFQKLSIHDKKITVEVVNTEASTEQGLSDRAQIGSDGMLFAFPQSQIQHFWMKEMRFDLDMVWLNNLRIIDISHNVPMPRPDQTLQQLPVFSSKAPANEVLEIPAGTAENWNLKIGDQFELTQ